MKKYSVENNRITAFIFIEEKFYSHKYHTECITLFLKEKGLIHKEQDLYNMLKDTNDNLIAKEWIKQIENNCIFGEIAHINNSLSVIVFEELTDYGLTLIKQKAFETFGINKVTYARFINLPNQKFQFIDL